MTGSIRKKKKTIVKPVDYRSLTWEQYEELRKQKYEARKAEARRRYHSSPAVKAAAKERYLKYKKKFKDPTFREKMRKYYRKKREEYNTDPEKVARQKERARMRYFYEGGKERHQAYLKQPKVRKKERARQRTPEFREQRRKRQTSDEYRAWQREYKKKKYQEKKQAKSR